MSLLRELLSRRTGRPRECRLSRPMLEVLERRDCPAVQAFYAAGVQTVVGDRGNNVIDLFQPQDRVVQVVGDGQTWMFTAVSASRSARDDSQDLHSRQLPQLAADIRRLAIEIEAKVGK
jgi:hypothetical protein